MRRLILAALVVLAAFTPPAPAEAREFIDSLGRRVTIPETVDRVLPAGPPAAVAVYTVAPEKMVGWVKPLAPEQAAFIAPPYRGLAVAGRLTGKAATIGAAAVQALHPDLIIDIGDLDPQYRALADRIQDATGIPYVVLDGRLAETPQLYAQLSELLDAKLQADMMTLLSAGILGRAAEAKKSALQPARIYYARDPDAPEGGGVVSLLDPEMLDALGALSVAGKQAVTPGQIADRNPDVILAANAAIARRILGDPAWRAVPAVAAGKVHVAPSLPFGWLGSPPGVNRLIGLEWLTALLYPRDPKRDFAAETRAFYRTYYHVELTDAEIGALLQP